MDGSDGFVGLLVLYVYLHCYLRNISLRLLEHWEADRGCVAVYILCIS